jgi:hypothetical protein
VLFPNEGQMCKNETMRNDDRACDGKFIDESKDECLISADSFVFLLQLLDISVELSNTNEELMND